MKKLDSCPKCQGPLRVMTDTEKLNQLKELGFAVENQDTFLISVIFGHLPQFICENCGELLASDILRKTKNPNVVSLKEYQNSRSNR